MFGLKVQGIVSESDIVGALFGQTEGLLNEDLELKHLQKTGKIGRISLFISNKSGKTSGRIEISTSLSKVQTAIVAAMLESVDRIGPTTCVITLDRIADVRKEKKDKIAARAAEIMKGWNIEQGEQVGDISTKVEKDARRGKVIKFGPDRLQAGPAISKSDKVIIVEGRADIVNLLGMNIENTIAVDGTRIPQTVINLCKNREVTALLDGDKGGDMILKELLLNASIEYVARAPIGKEIEEMKYDEVKTALKNKESILEASFLMEKLTVEEFLAKNKPRRRDQKPRITPRQPKRFTKKADGSERDESPRRERDPKKSDTRKDGRRDSRRDGRRDSRRDRDRPRRPTLPKAIAKLVDKTKQSFQTVFLNKDDQEILTVDTKDAFESLKSTDDIQTIILDGVITQRFIEAAQEKSVKLIAGAAIGSLEYRPKQNPEIINFNRM